MPFHGYDPNQYLEAGVRIRGLVTTNMPKEWNEDLDDKLKELESRQSEADLSPYMTTFENGCQRNFLPLADPKEDQKQVIPVTNLN